MGAFSTWDFQNFHVQQDLRGGQFVSAESTLVAAGLPNLSNYSESEGDLTVYPIGLLESVAVQQNKQLQRIFEIGSSRSYFIPGRTIGSLSVGRTFYFGPSLLRALYAYYKSDGALVSIGTAAAGATISIGDPARDIADPAAILIDTGYDDMHVVNRSPGEDYFYVDLASDLFAQPTGMAIYFKDYNSNSVGAFYLNECYVQGHQMTISSGSVLIMEGVSLQFDSITPIKMLV